MKNTEKETEFSTRFRSRSLGCTQCPFKEWTVQSIMLYWCQGKNEKTVRMDIGGVWEICTKGNNDRRSLHALISQLFPLFQKVANKEKETRIRSRMTPEDSQLGKEIWKSPKIYLVIFERKGNSREILNKTWAKMSAKRRVFPPESELNLLSLVTKLKVHHNIQHAKKVWYRRKTSLPNQRRQRVRAKQNVSNLNKVNKGVPQISIFEPILFPRFSKDLLETLSNKNN